MAARDCCLLFNLQSAIETRGRLRLPAKRGAPLPFNPPWT
jgi:hypothetical protein